MIRTAARRKTATIVPFQGRIYSAAAEPVWRPMSALDTTGRKVMLRLAIGPTRDRLGPEIIGWRAERESGPVYFCWDKATRSHVEVIALAWRPL